jgi:hypothetical protein
MKRALLVVLILVVPLLLLLVGVELLARPAIEQAIEDRVADRLDVSSVDARLGGFLVVPTVLATGEVSSLDVDVRGLVRPELTVDWVHVGLSGIELERGALLDGEARLQGVDRGEVEAEVTEADLQAAIPGGVAVLDLSPGQATVTAGGVTVDVGVSVAGGALRVDLGVLPPLTVPLPAEIFPCPLEGEVLEGRVRLWCTLDEVPDWMVQEVNRTS